MMEVLDTVLQRLLGVSDLRREVSALASEQDRHAELLLRHERELGELRGLLAARLER